MVMEQTSEKQICVAVKSREIQLETEMLPGSMAL
jgi:hypothetical protein